MQSITSGYIRKFYKSAQRDAKGNVKIKRKPVEICPPAANNDSGFLCTIGMLSFAASATICYAKYNEEFRDQVNQTFPFFNDIVAFFFQERKSFASRFWDFFDRSPKAEPEEKKEFMRELVNYHRKIN